MGPQRPMSEFPCCCQVCFPLSSKGFPPGKFLQHLGQVSSICLNLTCCSSLPACERIQASQSLPPTATGWGGGGRRGRVATTPSCYPHSPCSFILSPIVPLLWLCMADVVLPWAVEYRSLRNCCPFRLAWLGGLCLAIPS